MDERDGGYHSIIQMVHTWGVVTTPMFSTVASNASAPSTTRCNNKGEELPVHYHHPSPPPLPHILTGHEGGRRPVLLTSVTSDNRGGDQLPVDLVLVPHSLQHVQHLVLGGIRHFGADGFPLRVLASSVTPHSLRPGPATRSCCHSHPLTNISPEGSTILIPLSASGL